MAFMRSSRALNDDEVDHVDEDSDLAVNACFDYIY